MSNLAQIERVVQRDDHPGDSPVLWAAFLEELRQVRAELEALKNSKYTVPDGYRVMLIHESE